MKWLFLLLSLTSCGRVCIQCEMEQLNEEVCTRTGYYFPDYEIDPCEVFAEDQVVFLALSRNPQLDARLQQIGVTKSDLVQSGLLTNPQISLDWRLPAGGSSIEASALLALTDLWQRPIRKRLAACALEVTSFEVLDAVLHTIADAKQAYLERLYSMERYQLGQQLLEETQSLHSRILYRQGFGYSSELDIDLSAVMVVDEEMRLLEIERELAFTQLRLNALLALEQVEISGCLPTGIIEPESDLLVQIALQCNPHLQALRSTVSTAQEALRLEKSRVIRQLWAGLAYEHEPDGGSGYGPGLALQLPIFDQNQAQIARAQFKLEQARSELLAAELELEKKLRAQLCQLATVNEQLRLTRERRLPALENGLAYAEKYSATMQLNLLTLLEMRRRLTEASMEELMLVHDAASAWVEIERLVSTTS